MVGNARAILIGLALVAIVVNVLQFRTIEQGADPRYAALGRLPSPLLQESLSESQAIADIYSLFFHLSEVAPGSQLHIAADSRFPITSIRDNALGFGRADSVSGVEFDETVDWVTQDDLDTEVDTYHLEGSGSVWLPHHGDVPWQIVTGDCSTSSVGNDSTSFAVFHLRDAGDTSLLLIETCLAPEGMGAAK
ncbi:MAG: hypothetical protein WED09_06030 [Homoserinimonas sp.]